ncbi:MAG: MBL fold metallo-hydrolase [Clostridiales bacterium]|jgi:glyoxylase-like metal-dependent hydrolase (beta-lactamase superfamily II)|nr:MBL fold metallo-hydrolase [Clostridiales bacterium]
MILETITVGNYMTNCYLFGDAAAGEIMIIDPGGEPERIIAAVTEGKYTVKYIALTHTHFDHIGALDAVTKRFGAPPPDGEVFSVGKYAVEVIKTPGHTADSVCYKTDGILFSGDTLFHRSVGRTDLPTGDYDLLAQSVRKLYLLPGDTAVCPGHGRRTDIGAEQRHNPFIRL